MTKIFVPFPDKKYIDFYIQQSISGFIIGIKDFSMNFNNYVRLKDLENIIKDLKKKNMEVYISLNRVYYKKDIRPLKRLLSFISEYKVDGLMFCDVSIYNIVKENDLNINLIWNSNHLGTNYKTINFWEKRGVIGSILSDELNINEVLTIKKNTNSFIGIKLYGYLQMVTSSRELLSNFFTFLDKPIVNKKDYMILDNEKYPIIEENNETNIFSSKVLNGIKYFPKLIKNNIDFIILDDYMIESNYFYNVIEAFFALTRAPFDEEFVKKLIKVVDTNTVEETFLGFLNKKMIYKVKSNE